ncbi:MAG: DNA replication/repair protein RecF [Nocardioidaceae bacterium]
MHVAHLSLHDFRSYERLDLALEPGGNVFVGPNGQGKTNLVEAIDYLSTLASHRVATDAPLVRSGADRAVVRADVIRDGRSALLEVEIVPGGSNRARVNKSPLPRARELIGLLRTVVFSPEDLALVKGDPSDRRRFLDMLLVTRTPRLAGVRSDYDRILRQRNTLLKTAGAGRRGSGDAALATLDVWDEHLAQAGSALLAARLELVEALRPYVASGYGKIAAQASVRMDVGITYKSSFELPTGAPDREVLAAALLAAVAARRSDELERGVSLVGPHRDELVLSLGDLAAKGYASHGESWSLALALRIAAYDLLRSEGDDPILILDDVFAELDKDRRDQLAGLVGDAEQVLVTAPVPQDVPALLEGVRYDVMEGVVTRV